MIGQLRRIIVAKTDWDKGSSDQSWVPLIPKIEETMNNTKAKVTQVTPNDAVAGKDQGTIWTKLMEQKAKGKGDTQHVIKHWYEDGVVDPAKAPLLEHEYGKLKEAGFKGMTKLLEVGDIVKAQGSVKSADRGKETFKKGFEAKFDADDMVVAHVYHSAPPKYGVYSMASKKVLDGSRYLQQLIVTGKKASSAVVSEALEAFKQTAGGQWQMHLKDAKIDTSGARVWQGGKQVSVSSIMGVEAKKRGPAKGMGGRPSAWQSHRLRRAPIIKASSNPSSYSPSSFLGARPKDRKHVFQSVLQTDSKSFGEVENLLGFVDG